MFRLVEGSVLGVGYVEELARAVWIVNLGAGCWLLANRLCGSRLCEGKRPVVKKVVRVLGCTPLGNWNDGRTRLRACRWATTG